MRKSIAGGSKGGHTPDDYEPVTGVGAMSGFRGTLDGGPSASGGQATSEAERLGAVWQEVSKRFRHND
jgi:hypothetical protein